MVNIMLKNTPVTNYKEWRQIVNCWPNLAATDYKLKIAIKEFNLDGGDVESDKILDELFNDIEKYQDSLVSLEYKEFGLTEEHLLAITQLIKHGNLTNLTLSFDDINEAAVNEFITTLGNKECYLATLNLYNTNIDDQIEHRIAQICNKKGIIYTFDNELNNSFLSAARPTTTSSWQQITQPSLATNKTRDKIDEPHKRHRSL